MEVVLIPIYFLLVISYLIMIPSATASWYSQCFKLPFIQGVGIAASPIIAGMIIRALKTEVANGEWRPGLGTIGTTRMEHTDASWAVQNIYIFAMASLLTYGVYKQVMGKCNLGYR